MQGRVPGAGDVVTISNASNADQNANPLQIDFDNIHKTARTQNACAAYRLVSTGGGNTFANWISSGISVGG